MKIRIQGNSLRFRLRQREVKHFKEHGEIKEEMCFGTLSADKLSFVLKATHSEMFEIFWEGNMVTVQVPISTSSKWTNTDLVGFEVEANTGKQQVIRILIEKDFKCLDGVGVDNEDAYPNPKEFC